MAQTEHIIDNRYLWNLDFYIQLIYWSIVVAGMA